MIRLLPIFFALVLFSCGASETDVETGSTNDDGTSEVVADKVLTDGDYTETYKDGSLKIKGTILGGERYGTWFGYHKNGNKASESEYRNGNLNGKTVAYHENGQISYIGYYENNFKAGVWQFYKKDGTPSGEEDYTKK